MWMTVMAVGAAVVTLAVLTVRLGLENRNPDARPHRWWQVFQR